MNFLLISRSRITDYGPTHSKLLNYIMVRTLEMVYPVPVHTSELHRILLVLEPLVYHLLLSGQDSILDCFDDGWDDVWNMTSAVMYSAVFGQIFCHLFRRAHGDLDAQLMTMAGLLLSIRDAAEQPDATQFAIGNLAVEFNMFDMNRYCMLTFS